MPAPKERYYYNSNMDSGEFTVYIPAEVSEFDCDQMEAQFAIMIRQARRRATKDTVTKPLVAE